ncbi:MAG: hypothetical protein A2V90_04270 [Gammaproteobacteria bacterium RBG_16_57_12]|nr:MAG: hypothetical protein A2V90_04270 [Gammaproteobacteria bacterium RBG_16_57_12]
MNRLFMVFLLAAGLPGLTHADIGGAGPGCQAPSEYAQTQLQKILDIITPAKGIHFCETGDILHARGMLKQTGEVPHPYISWKKVPVLEPFVFYNADLLNQMDSTSGTRFTSLAIIAHEIGAVLKQNNESDKSNVVTLPDEGSVADYYSGYVLARLKADTADMKAAQHVLFSIWNEIHSEKAYQRLQSAVRGWLEGGGVQLAVDDLKQVTPTLYSEVDKW